MVKTSMWWTAVFLLLIIGITSSVSPLIASSSQTGAYAQEDNDQITIDTSADSHDGKFFGQSALQVVVYDPDDDASSNLGTKNIDLDAEADSGSDSATIVVPETSNSSGKFEFFLSHSLATEIQAEDLDPQNSAGVEGDGSCVENCAPFVKFGPDSELDTDSDLYEEVRFEIRVDDAMVVVNYDETHGKLRLDRELYGPTSFVYVFVDDQDSNLNPFERDEFTFSPESPPNGDLFSLDGGNFIGAMTFKETGDNTAVFEGKFQLGSDINAESESLALTLHEKANYNSTLDASENDSNVTEEVFFVVRSTSGTINGGPAIPEITPTWDAILESDKDSYSIGETMNITITDQDANKSASAIDTIILKVWPSASGNVTVFAYETNKTSGIFVVAITLGSETDVGSKSVVIPDGDSLAITYLDLKPADYAEKIAAMQNPEKEFSLHIQIRQQTEDNESLTRYRSVNMSIPVIRDAAGKQVDRIEVGNQILLSTTTINELDVGRSFVAIVEVRNSENATIFLEWQAGNLNPSGETDIAISWLPTAPGGYFVRTFAISDLSEGAILSQVSESRIIVGI